MGASKEINENVCVWYKRAMKKKLVRGRSVEDVALAIFHAAYILNGVPRTLDEIASYHPKPVKKTKHRIGRAYKAIKNKLKLDKLSLKILKPENYVSRFCSELGLGTNVISKTNEILKELYNEGYNNIYKPTGTAAAVIYMASKKCKEKKPQRKICDVTGVCEPTLRKRYKEFEEMLGLNH